MNQEDYINCSDLGSFWTKHGSSDFVNTT